MLRTVMFVNLEKRLHPYLPDCLVPHALLCAWHPGAEAAVLMIGWMSHEH